MHLEFSGDVWFWRGPSPYHFVTVPDDESAEIESVAAVVSYGWGQFRIMSVEHGRGSTAIRAVWFPTQAQQSANFLAQTKRQPRDERQCTDCNPRWPVSRGEKSCKRWGSLYGHKRFNQQKQRMQRLYQMPTSPLVALPFDAARSTCHASGLCYYAADFFKTDRQ